MKKAPVAMIQRIRPNLRLHKGQESRLLICACTLFCFAACLFICSSVFADDETRRIWAEEYVKKDQPAPPPAAKKPKQPHYRGATPEVAADKLNQETVVGITIWKFRPAQESEAAVTIAGEQLVAERVEGNTILAKGDRVRLAIEAARDGYLYVINREKYADGSTGEPYLIYPTSHLTGGDNRTMVGRMIVIPAQSDRPPYFTLSPGRPDQISEMLSVFITSEPLKDISIGSEPLQIPAAKVQEWENKWGKTIGRLEMIQGAGQSLTPAEQEAGTGSRLLKHSDPTPQSIYYNPELKTGEPLFVNVNLQYEPEPK